MERSQNHFLFCLGSKSKYALDDGLTLEEIERIAAFAHFAEKDH
jgi:hypothetical protein